MGIDPPPSLYKLCPRNCHRNIDVSFHSVVWCLKVIRFQDNIHRRWRVWFLTLLLLSASFVISRFALFRLFLNFEFQMIFASNFFFCSYFHCNFFDIMKIVSTYLMNSAHNFRNLFDRSLLLNNIVHPVIPYELTPSSTSYLFSIQSYTVRMWYSVAIFSSVGEVKRGGNLLLK